MIDINPIVNQVTPCMGVWIETLSVAALRQAYAVTPCMGVWIETDVTLLNRLSDMSHPVWVCGLKPCTIMLRAHILRHTLYGCVD